VDFADLKRGYSAFTIKDLQLGYYTVVAIASAFLYQECRLLIKQAAENMSSLKGDLLLMMAAVLLLVAGTIYQFTRPRPVYLMDFSICQGPEACRTSHDAFMVCLSIHHEIPEFISDRLTPKV
jgi:hypothetical protein